jgi:hypothetical protein
LVARGHENERVKLAGQWLGFATETLVNPAPTLRAQENAGAVFSLIQSIAGCPRRPMSNEERQIVQGFVFFPTLAGDALAFALGNEDSVFMATSATGVAVPVLKDW